MKIKCTRVMERKLFLSFVMTILILAVKDIACREFELEDSPLKLDKVKAILPLLHEEIRTKNFKLIIHGYGGHLDFKGSKNVRNAYLKKSNTIVIVVDWSRLAKLPCYPSAAINTKQAGECTAQFLMALEKHNEGFKASRIHAVGFSLGAHVASFASNAVERMSGLKFDRITGLDPALPFFASARKHWKLDSSDGKFVDILHTNAGFYGKMEACGHSDFYINNGQHQPACFGANNENTCSHLMALDYFAESINSNIGFYGRRCESYLGFVFGWCNLQKPNPRLQSNISSEWSQVKVKMGEDCRKKAEGIVFVRTHRKSPFAMG